MSLRLCALLPFLFHRPSVRVTLTGSRLWGQNANVNQLLMKIFNFRDAETIGNWTRRSDMPPADTQDPFADMRPHHNHDHWVTKWIRSYMVTPEDRERKLAAVLGKMKMGADELCASPPPPTPPR